jgi:glucosamine--fructose-6-phosphate aminotransferase (isomerizing)
MCRVCGIVGYKGHRDALPILIEGLKRLEYRGYDSAGVVVLGDEMSVQKAAGQISVLEDRLEDAPGTMGLGHTRWATHGRPSDLNAHPFSDCTGDLAIIHNGIVENYQVLKEELLAKGHEFVSETDTETLAHLFEDLYEGDLVAAVRAGLKRVEGNYAVGVVHKDHPDIMVAARRENPLVVGISPAGETLLASDVTPLLGFTNEFTFVEDGDVVVLGEGTIEITDLEGRPVERSTQTVDWSVEDAQRGGFEHFMLKEIFEQPQAILESLMGRITDEEMASLVPLEDVDKVKIIACGTSYHAGLIGKYILESLAGLDTTVEMASEYRYSNLARETALVVAITQSGETIDTISAVREAKRRGTSTLAITNVVGSSITREADHIIYTRAGPEIGVAATKTFTTQLIALYLMAISLGMRRRVIGAEQLRVLREGLRRLPSQVQQVLNTKGLIRGVAETIHTSRDVYFIGRNINYPSAMEGALKLKEISYIHAEGYPAGELKHGPNALLGPETPVIAIVVDDPVRPKMLSNIGEVAARDSPVFAVGLEDDVELEKLVDMVVPVPRTNPIFSPVVVVVALQLLSYYTAHMRGCSIDKPRNLAKSVTVE